MFLMFGSCDFRLGTEMREMKVSELKIHTSKYKVVARDGLKTTYAVNSVERSEKHSK